MLQHNWTYVCIYVFAYWIQMFSLILDSSVGLSADNLSDRHLVPETLGPNPAFSRGRELVFFRFHITPCCQSIDNNTNKYVNRQSQG